MSERSTYAFRNSSQDAVTQMQKLQEFMDPITTDCLTGIGIPTNGKCLEIGPGGGSMAHFMAERVGPGGRVYCVDVDPSQVKPADNIEVLQRDIRDGVGVDEKFDLIHARLVLLHLPERREVFKTLVDALKPGGWLVLGEFGPEPLRVYTAPSQDDAKLYDKVAAAVVETIGAKNGMDMNWAYEVYAEMKSAGLENVFGTERSDTWAGGAGAVLHHSNSFQLEQSILDTGITRQELERYRELTLDPQFCARSYQFINTVGQKSK